MAIQQTPDFERALQLAAERHASDLYLLPAEPVCLRVRGQIERTDGAVLSPDQVRQMALAAVGEPRLATITSEAGRAVVSCDLPGVVSGQMCIASSRGEYSIVVRMIPSRIFRPEELAVPGAFLRAAESTNGLLVFSGIPGSGKTTTVFSILEEINCRQAKHICTVEDPIAAVLPPKRSLVQQREIGVDVPDCLAGIAAAMRQDADVLFIGEMKTLEEVDAAISAAQMQYLVMTQLNTARTAEMAVQRLIEIQPAEQVAAFRRRLAQVLQGAIGQVLLPRGDGGGQVAAYSVLIPDAEMRRALAEGRELSDREHPLPAGCQKLEDDIQRLLRQGIVNAAAAEEAIQAARVGG